MNLVDSSGWIEYFTNGPNASYFAKPIEQTGDLIVPVVCLFEVYKKVRSSVDEKQALMAVTQMKLGRIVDITEDIALSAASISLDSRLGMADSLIYAIARSHRAFLWTQDEDFKNLPNVFYKGKAAPKRS